VPPTLLDSDVRYFANPSSQKVRDAMSVGLLDFIDTPLQRNLREPGVEWCADNGCFSSGYPGDAAWLAWLTKQASRPDAALCVFAVAPDVVGDAEATLARSKPWLPVIRGLGFTPAFVGQDGQEHLPVPWESFDVLFIGGSTEWKLGPEARKLIAEAQQLGKYVHMGRVNTKGRLQYALSLGCDSVDGTFLKYGPDVNLPRLLRWLLEIGAYDAR